MLDLLDDELLSESVGVYIWISLISKSMSVSIFKPSGFISLKSSSSLSTSPKNFSSLIYLEVLYSPVPLVIYWTFSFKALLILLRLNSSIIISVDSLPVKKMNGMWQPSTTAKIILRTYDSQWSPSLATLLRTFWSTTEPKKKIPRNAIIT